MRKPAICRIATVMLLCIGVLPGTAAAAPTADLTVTGAPADLATPVYRGAGYVLTLRNVGPDQANGATLTAKLPTGVTLVSATSAAGNCSTSGALSCKFGKFEANTTITVNLVFLATTGGTRTLTFVAASSSDDLAPATNTTTLTLRVAPCTHLGTSGNDVLVGTTGIDVMCGGAGNDVLRGRGGNDVLRGGTGADSLSGGGGKDALYGGSGNDVIVGNAGVDRLYGQSGRDTLVSRDGLAELVNGGLGTDRGRIDRMLDIRRSVEVLY